MLRFILTRVSLVIPTFIGMTLLTFVMIRLIPGDPIEALAGEHGVDPTRHEELRHQFGFDKPLLIQYLLYVSRVLHGDLPNSLSTHQPVLTEFTQLFPATIELSVSAMLFAVILGLPAGILAATRRGKFLDHSVMGVSLVGYSMPIFWWGLLLILFFSVYLGWTPVSGRIDIAYDFDSVTGFMLIDSLLSGQDGAFTSAMSHLILPMIVLGTIPLAVIARMTRSSMLEVLNEDYIRTARAKGLAPRIVDLRHVLRNALLPVSTIVGLQVGLLLSGAILTETVFAYPGIGSWLRQAISDRNYPVIQGGILFVAIIVVFVNLLVDISYGLINPRIRLGRK